MDPLTAYTFRVRIGDLEFGFSRVSGLSRETASTVYQEGGLNDRVHVLRGPVKACGVLRMERGVYEGEAVPFYFTGERLNQPVRIEVCSAGGDRPPGKIYTLTGLVVKKWEAGELDAMQSAVLIDRFELEFEYLDISVR